MNNQALEILSQHQAVLRDGHFIYTSGKHGSEYMNKDAIYPHTDSISQLCELMAKDFNGEGIEAVLAPALGGIVLSQWTAHHLSKIEKKKVLAVFAEKNTDGEFILKRGYDDLLKGKKVLVVEDVLNTGGSVKKVVSLARGLGINVVAVSVLCNRAGVKPEDLGGNLKLKSLVELSFPSWDSKDCPLCKKGVPVNTSLGKGKFGS